MKNTFLFLLFIISTTTLSFGQSRSQKVDLLWGPEQKESKRSTLSDIVGYDATGFYALKTLRGSWINYSKITIEHYNQEMVLTKSEELNLEYDGKEMKYESILQMGDNLFLFASFRNKKVDQKFLFVQNINKKSLKLDGEPRKIAEIDFGNKGKWNSGDYSLEVSRDTSKILVYYDLPYEKGESEKFGMHVFDQQMQELWSKEITLPYLEELFRIEDYVVDNNGNVHLLGVIFKDKKNSKRSGKPNYKYQILSYRDQGNQLKEYPVEIKDKFLADMRIVVNEDQDIICAGFYSNESASSILGSYFLRINGESKELVVKKFKEFGMDFITQNLTEKQEEKVKKKSKKGKSIELFQYDLNQLIIRNDGGVVLVAEQYIIRDVSYTTTGANGITKTKTKVYYHYNTIIVINMAPDGSIDWAEKIPKRQASINDGGFFSSYVLSVVGDKLYFAFNDDPKNLFNKEEDKPHFFTPGREAMVVLVELDRQGKQTKEALFSSKEAEVMIRPKVCEQIASKELVLFGQKKKKHRFVKLTFK